MLKSCVNNENKTLNIVTMSNKIKMLQKVVKSALGLLFGNSRSVRKYFFNDDYH